MKTANHAKFSLRFTKDIYCNGSLPSWSSESQGGYFIKRNSWAPLPKILI